ncbi:TRAP transporter substrate-binding protein DctP [Escherichia coli]|nr:TRAP transporter substrate-binding protein DctP [Escherichia coli]
MGKNGWRDVTNSRAPVKTPADLKGLKIRTNNSPMNIAAFKVFGANPIPMPFAEVYTGLETRTIDAQEHPINVVWSAKFFRSAEIPFSDPSRLFPASGGDQQSEV